MSTDRQAITTKQSFLECRGLTKRYGTRILFSNLDLSLNPLDSVAITGASGSGKTTLLHCLQGIETLDSGSVTIAGQVLQEQTPKGIDRLRRKSLGTVFQFFHLLPTLTAFENIELTLQLAGTAPREAAERVSDLLQRLQLAHRADAFPRELSGGEMQRVAIARAIAHRPQLVLADEPTGNLDKKTGCQALELLSSVCREERAALLMVTHSKTSANICAREYRLEDESLHLIR